MNSTFVLLLVLFCYEFNFCFVTCTAYGRKVGARCAPMSGVGCWLLGCDVAGDTLKKQSKKSNDIFKFLLFLYFIFVMKKMSC